VRTPQGEIHAESVVVCAGAHAAPLLAPLGLLFPVAPVRFDAFVTTPLPPLFERRWWSTAWPSGRPCAATST
jgi:sarcosine oxidase subunit beta